LRVTEVTNKTQTALASLVAAVPAGVLGYFVVTSFLAGLEHLPTTFQGLYGATLAGCAAIVFLPFAVLIFGQKSPARPKAAVGTGKVAAPKGAESGESVVAEGFEQSSPEIDAEAIEEEIEAPASTGELEIVEPTSSEIDLDSFGSLDDSEIGSKTESIPAADDDDFKFDDEDIEPPKKKKR